MSKAISRPTRSFLSLVRGCKHSLCTRGQFSGIKTAKIEPETCTGFRQKEPAAHSSHMACPAQRQHTMRGAASGFSPENAPRDGLRFSFPRMSGLHQGCKKPPADFWREFRFAQRWRQVPLFSAIVGLAGAGFRSLCRRSSFSLLLARGWCKGGDKVFPRGCRCAYCPKTTDLPMRPSRPTKIMVLAPQQQRYSGALGRVVKYSPLPVSSLQSTASRSHWDHALSGGSSG